MDKWIQIAEALLSWYPAHARDLPWRRDTDPYHVWLSEIMLQQTRVEAVKEYYVWFLKEFPTIEALAAADEDKLLKMWEGLGYYNRARNLQKAAITVVHEYDGRFPETYEEILSLAGIGDYTAGAIGSICFQLPTPAVDGNVLRVYTRVMEDSSNIDQAAVRAKIRRHLSEVYPFVSCGTFTQSLMELGATVCVPNGMPKCDVCPLRPFCLAGQNGTWQAYPVRAVKKARRLEDKTVFILRCGDKVAVRKRQQKGLLSGMWEFPNIEGTVKEQQAADVATQWQTLPKQLEMNYNYTHIFSHVEWRMTAYYFACQSMCRQFHWVTLEELDKQVAIPSAFRPFMEILKESAHH